MFTLKRVVDLLSNPLVCALMLAVAALAFRLAGRVRTAKVLGILAGAAAYLFSTTFVGSALLKPLERQFPPLPEDQRPAVPYVVVLGTGYSPHDGVPVTAALAPDGLTRIVEGVRLMRRYGASHLIVSGGAPRPQVPSAVGYARLASDLGVASDALIVLDGGLDTAAEARAVAATVKGSGFILVTSAYHMPRAIRLMRRAGLQPIPAPTGQMTRDDCGLNCWIPGAAGLGRSERALHEYLGFAALAMRVPD